MRRLIALLLFLALTIGAHAPAGQRIGPPATPSEITLGGRGDSVKFAVLGDNGTGQQPQYSVANEMAAARARFPFELVIMLGDNLYGSQKPQDLLDKFERPYKALLNAGVRFYPALGNHDDAAVQQVYPLFNMNGSRYYTYAVKNVRFVLDTNVLDPKQLAWAESAMKDASEPWRVCTFIIRCIEWRPSRLERRAARATRAAPGSIRHRCRVLGPRSHVRAHQAGKRNYVFVAGAGGQLRKGGVSPSDLTAAAFAQDQSFMLVEIAGDELVFQAISRTGIVVDAGLIHKRPKT